MALYIELHDIGRENTEMHKRVQVAVAVAAEKVYNDPTPPANQAERLAWAKNAISPGQIANEALQMMSYILAAERDLTKAQIEGADDDALQNRVDEAVNFFV